MAKQRKRTRVDDLFESPEQRAEWEAGGVERFRYLLYRIELAKAELAAKQKQQQPQ
jgi:hypothetical protein